MKEGVSQTAEDQAETINWPTDSIRSEDELPSSRKEVCEGADQRAASPWVGSARVCPACGGRKAAVYWKHRLQ